MGNDYVERERKSNIDINERRRLLRTKQSNEMNRLRQRQQQQIQQLAQKHRDQSTELERQISDEAHWIRCENPNSHCFISAVNRSDWRVEKWSGWRESNPLHNQNSNEQQTSDGANLTVSPFSQWISHSFCEGTSERFISLQHLILEVSGFSCCGDYSSWTCWPAYRVSIFVSRAKRFSILRICPLIPPIAALWSWGCTAIA